MPHESKKSISFSLFILIAFAIPLFYISAHEVSPAESANLFITQADYFTHIVETDGAQQALSDLRAQSLTDKHVAENCHDLAHLVGHTAFKKYGDFATTLSYYDEVCNSGYIHGAIEEYLSNAPDPVAALNDVCLPYAPISFLGWQCYHGVGHGLMFSTEYDVPKSLTSCAAFTDARAAASCTNGVFMENFNADGDRHKSTFVKTDDLFYPCGDMPSALKDDCYIYAPVHYLNLHKEDYKGALDWCASGPIGYRVTCTTGVGSQLEKEHLLDPGVVEKACTTGALWQITPCIRGAAMLAVFNEGSTEPGYALCGAFSYVRGRICTRAVASFEGLFQS